jgi:hypothetical protein
MSKDFFQIFVMIEGKTHACEVSNQTNINDFKRYLSKKFKLPYIKDMSSFPELKSPTPFYLRYSGKRLDNPKFDTISDYNNKYEKYPIEKESTIHLMIIFSSKIWNMIQEKVINREQFILEDN